MIGLPGTEIIQAPYTIFDLLNGKQTDGSYWLEDEKCFIEDIFTLKSRNDFGVTVKADIVTGFMTKDNVSHIKHEGFGDTVRIIMESGNCFVSGPDTLFAVGEKDEYRIFPEVEEFDKCKAKDLEGKKLLFINDHSAYHCINPIDVFTDIFYVDGLDKVVKVETYKAMDLYSFVGPASHWAGLHSGEYFYFVHDSFVDAKTVINKGWVDAYQIDKAYEEYKSEGKCTSSRNNLEFLYGILIGE